MKKSVLMWFVLSLLSGASGAFLFVEMTNDQALVERSEARQEQLLAKAQTLLPEGATDVAPENGAEFDRLLLDIESHQDVVKRYDANITFLRNAGIASGVLALLFGGIGWRSRQRANPDHRLTEATV